MPPIWRFDRAERESGCREACKTRTEEKKANSNGANQMAGAVCEKSISQIEEVEFRFRQLSREFPNPTQTGA